MRLVFVDIDGTLITGLSTEKRFYLYLLRTGNQGPRQILAFLWFLMRYGLRYGRHILKKNKAYLTGLRVEKIRSLADAWVESGLDGAVYGPCLERIRRHQAEGHRVILLSGTPDFVAEAIGRWLGVDKAIGSDCARRRDCFWWRPPEQHPFGETKLAIAREVCDANGSDLGQASVYGDSIHDLPLLSRAANPVAVRPDRDLAAIACSQGWEIIGDREPGGFRTAP